jgi:hypothetical protein
MSLDWLSARHDHGNRHQSLVEKIGVVTIFFGYLSQSASLVEKRPAVYRIVLAVYASNVPGQNNRDNRPWSLGSLLLLGVVKLTGRLFVAAVVGAARQRCKGGRRDDLSKTRPSGPRPYIGG